MEFCAANGRFLPGFRFHPTDEELVMYYLKRKVLGKLLEAGVIAELDIYLFHPEDLPRLACLKKDLNWYFFCPRGKKYGSGDRTNRATDTGYWKATGNDRDVSYQKRIVGKIKTLVFHHGKPPKGERTDWVMHEYRLEDRNLADKGVFLDSYVLCKIFKKSGWGPKNGEQYGARFIEEEWDDDDDIPNGTQVVPVVVANQSASVMTNSAATSILVSVNAFPTSTSEQVCSGAVSVSAVDQAPSPMLTAAANIVSSSRGMIPDYNDPVDKELTVMSVAADWASTSMGPPNYTDPVVQACSPMPKASDMASTSMESVPIYDDDETDIITADDFGEIFGSLEDLDNNAVQGSGGGLDLTDLDRPL